MSINVGEEIVSEYLRYIKSCDFVEKNLHFPDSQGELDVLGINLEKKIIYACEVAIHIRGLQYVKNIGGKNSINNKNKIKEKFIRDKEFLKRYFSGYKHVYMFWSPVVGKGRNQEGQLKEAVNELKNEHDIDIELIINQKFLECIEELRKYAGKQKNNIDTPITRFLQIEEHLKRTRRHKNKGGKL